MSYMTLSLQTMMLPWQMTLAFSQAFTEAWADMMTDAADEGREWMRDGVQTATDTAESGFAQLDHTADDIARAATETSI